MSNQTLYQLADEYATAAAILADTDIPAEAVEDTLAGLAGEFADKALSVGKLLAHIENQVDGLNIALDNIKSRRDVLEARAERLRAYLVENMRKVGKEKIEDAYISLRVVANKEHVEIIQGTVVPREYMRPQPTPAAMPNKLALFDALKNGEVIQGISLQRTYRLAIK